MWLLWRAKIAAGAAILLGFLALYVKTLKYQRDRAVQVSETLKSRHHVIKQQAIIKREEKKKLFSRTASIVKEIEEEKFKGVKNLKDSNDY